MQEVLKCFEYLFEKIQVKNCVLNRYFDLPKHSWTIGVLAPRLFEKHKILKIKLIKFSLKLLAIEFILQLKSRHQVKQLLC